MLQDRTSAEALTDCYTGGWLAIRALNTAGYPGALGHFVENHYSARFSVHQGSCSGILCARLLAYHAPHSGQQQRRIAAALGGEESGRSAAQLISDLVAQLPGVAKDHHDANVDPEALGPFAEWLYDRFAAKLNELSPTPFGSAADLLGMLTRPLVDL